ncbi:basic proline-rich protein-like [Haemorhous mexicanus]|uniref:basic proline-rich protein-like n=1 Tax=Haemorhous mexicanus TaxID=30427 RepID=UPI0028BE16A5|nr:basic proline-rich protein-like [Haemorhous mexicanus]
MLQPLNHLHSPLLDQHQELQYFRPHRQWVNQSAGHHRPLPRAAHGEGLAPVPSRSPPGAPGAAPAPPEPRDAGPLPGARPPLPLPAWHSPGSRLTCSAPRRQQPPLFLSPARPADSPALSARPSPLRPAGGATGAAPGTAAEPRDSGCPSLPVPPAASRPAERLHQPAPGCSYYYGYYYCYFAVKLRVAAVPRGAQPGTVQPPRFPLSHRSRSARRTAPGLGSISSISPLGRLHPHGSALRPAGPAGGAERKSPLCRRRC